MIGAAGRSSRLAVVSIAAALLLGVLSAPRALAASPRWQLSVSSAPTNLPPGGEGQVAIAATNIGDGPASGSSSPVTITLKLPPGVSATSVLAFPLTYAGYLTHSGELACELPSSSLLSCTWKGEEGEQKELPLPPYETLEARVAVKVSEAAQAGEVSEATISGGEAPAASVVQPLAVSSAPTPFGVRDFKLAAENEDGSPDTQAGSHPFQLTSTIDLEQILESREAEDAKPTLPALLNDVHVELPPGLVGNITAFPTCTDLEFESLRPGNVNLCPPESAVGVASVTIHEPINQGMATLPVPIFNLTPGKGEPARFGFEALGVPVVLDTAVRAGRDYGVDVDVNSTSEAAALLSSRVTFWGTPGDPRHDPSRGWSCLDYFAGGTCSAPSQRQQTPLLTLPTSCSGALQTRVEADSWQTPGSFAAPPEPALTQAMTGCGLIPFDPEINVESSSHEANTPTELTVRLRVPQEVSEAPSGVAESAVRNTSVTLPAGLQVNPAAAAGLQTCSEADIGYERSEADGQAIFSEDEAHCPDASKLGSVTITTPLLSEALEGAVYQAAQGANPFGSLLALYIVAEAPNAGVRVKLAGEVTPNPVTGQLTSTFEQTPQLPFAEFDLKLFGGSRAPLATSACGAYHTETSIEPWSGNAAATPTSEFDVDSEPDGGPCQSPAFAPLFVAGMTNNQAGAFSPFTLAFSRRDGEQTLSAISTQMPPGLLGMLSRVQLCEEPQAAAGSCPSTSQIGHVTVAAGVGSEPIALPETGKPQDPVFLTGPYKGAPFGLSIVVPAEAGPFNLGTVVVRAAVRVDPNTSQISVASDPMPTRLQGIPLDVRTVDVAIDRAGFMFGPTNCEPLAIDGSIDSAEGAVASVSSRYEAANCGTLPFNPGFSASTQAKTSKANGASLVVKITQKPGEADIHKVDVQLPLALPSRLSTLQKACTEAQFNADPAGCPAGSVIGTATAHTPVLQAPLTGPAYLVSHGGAAFPDTEFVLQADERRGDIEIVLDGKTQIKKGITYSHFETVPDAPISSFEARLPEGPHSVLSTEYPGRTNLCALDLLMPTTLVGQNGAQLERSTKLAVSGCRMVTIRRRKLSRRSVVLAFALTAKGTVTVTGRGLRRYRKTLAAGSHQISVALSNAGLSMRAHHREIKIKVALRSRLKVSSAITALRL